MTRDHRRWILLPLICGLPAACTQPASRLNSPPQGDTPHRSEMQPAFTYMVDNAAISDLSITDIHFVPHTTELNSLGTARLSRIAMLIDPYGGTVRYAARLTDQAMVAERVEHVRDFLETTGVDMSRIEVTIALAGSHHTSATEAIEAAARGMAASHADGEGTETSD